MQHVGRQAAQAAGRRAIRERRDHGLGESGRRHLAPARFARRGDAEEAPVCTLEIDPRGAEALTGVSDCPRLQVLYWMNRERRDLVLQSPRHDGDTRGTFALRSPVRPNPVASSVVRLVDVDGLRVQVRGLDCLDGTPLIDLKVQHD